MVGIIGALVGLAIAAFDWFVVLPALLRPLSRTAAEMRGKDAVRAQRSLAIVRWVFLAQFLVFPVVGYVIGDTVF